MEEEKDCKLDPSQLQFRGNFNKQVKEIFQFIRMPKYRVKKIEKLIEFEDTLNKLFEGCRVKAFGSIVMGLALKTSDVDCFVETCNEEPKMCIQRTVAYFKEHPHIFKDVHVKTNKKLSVINLFHSEYNIICEISFSGPRAVNIGQLISHFLEMDPRALRLAILIKYWAKVHDISDTKLLPGHALTFLVIFFLQYKTILPSVAFLQENLTPQIIDEWNVAFARITEFPSDNTDTIYQLLGEFFEYYRDFEFNDQIVSPYVGIPVPRRDAASKFALYKNVDGVNTASITALNCPICVQCPFEHSRNIAIAVKQDLGNKIQSQFRFAAEMYETCNKSAFLRSILQKQILSKNVQGSHFHLQASGSLHLDQFHGQQHIAIGESHGSRRISHKFRGQRRGFRGQMHRFRGQAHGLHNQPQENREKRGPRGHKPRSGHTRAFTARSAPASNIYARNSFHY